MSLNGQDQEKGVVEYQARDGQKIKLTPAIIKNYLVSGRAEFVTDQELYLYMGVCKSRGLNPFIRDCSLVKYTPNDSAAIITSIDYYRKRARAQKDCKGWKHGIVIMGPGGDPKYREGCILLEGEKLVGGWAEAKPEGWDIPMRKEVNLKRYIKKTKDGSITRFWSPDNQPEMIAKVAESQLLRAVWPDEFQGLYVDAEIRSRGAQEELDEAVGTEGEDSGKFERDFEEQIKHPLFGDFVKEAAQTYGKDVDQMKKKMIDQVKDVRDGFVVWLEYRNKKDEKLTPGAEEVKFEEDKLTSGEEPTFRDEWAELGPKEFGVFVGENLERFKKADAEIRAEAVDRWVEFYKGFPCPFSGPGEGDEAVQAEKKIADPVDPEAAQRAELDLLQAEIRRLEKMDPAVVAAARASLGIVAKTTPANIDGCNRLIEEVKDVQRHRGVKKGRK